MEGTCLAALLLGRIVRRVGTPVPQGVAAGALKLDDVRSEAGRHPRAIGPRDALAQVEDAEPGQWPFHERSRARCAGRESTRCNGGR